MSRFTKYLWVLWILGLAGITACSGATPTPDPSIAYTQIWQTVELAQTQTGLVTSPTPVITDTPTVIETARPTHTPLITDTPLPGAVTATSSTVSPLKTATKSSGSSSTSCDNANFVSDVTIPDGTEITAGSTFVKTWRFKNLGPCTWTTSYHLVFSYVSDTGKNGVFDPPAAVNFPVEVASGDQMDISVTLTAPTKANTYQAVFVLQNAKGFNIPLVNEQSYEFYVLFVVK